MAFAAETQNSSSGHEASFLLEHLEAAEPSAERYLPELSPAASSQMGKLAAAAERLAAAARIAEPEEVADFVETLAP